jgi:lipopolysaccharide transport system ATP-binding protein
MTSPIITVENLSKRYHLGQIGATTLRDSTERFIHCFADAVKSKRFEQKHAKDAKGGGSAEGGAAGVLDLNQNLAGAASSLLSPLRSSRTSVQDSSDSADLWALKDVSFEVQPGEVLGIIGRNGAGKSTLLKILSRITEPTSGRAVIRGRVASLLEVGTGFHPELTGRENVFLNGAMLGMKKAEIARKFDEIVAFSDVERFIDTPVKRYSSGMYVRLAFAVAAHLEPEILIVDEVLAVGDAVFQKKCISKMSEVAHGGRTVLFVSHNMGAIRELCALALMMDKGRLIQTGSPDRIISQYLNLDASECLVYVNNNPSERPHIVRAEVMRERVGTMGCRMDEPLAIRIEVYTGGLRDLVVSVHIFNPSGQMVHHSSDEFCADSLGAAPVRICEIPSYGLAAGKYTISLNLAARNIEIYQHMDGVLSCEVVFCGKLSDRTTGEMWKGVCGPGLLKWHD